MPPLVPGQPLQLSEGLTVTPAAVPHRAEFSDAVGFFIQVWVQLPPRSVALARWLCCQPTGAVPS
jgi:hypothetical protein